MSNIGSAREYKQLVARAASEGRLLVAKFFTEDCYVSALCFRPLLRRVLRGQHPARGQPLIPASPVVVLTVAVAYFVCARFARACTPR